MAGLVGALYRSYQNSQFRPLQPALPIEGYARGLGVSFGLPWPWAQVSQPNAPHGTEAMIEVYAPRTDRPATLSVWRDQAPGDFEAIVTGAGRQISQLYRGRVHSVRKLIVSGTRAVLVCVDEPATGCTVWRLITELGDRFVHGEARVSAPAAAGTEPQVETMFATWSWT